MEIPVSISIQNANSDNDGSNAILTISLESVSEKKFPSLKPQLPHLVRNANDLLGQIVSAQSRTSCLLGLHTMAAMGCDKKKKKLMPPALASIQVHY
jgi:hypothetical protein